MSVRMFIFFFSPLLKFIEFLCLFGAELNITKKNEEEKDDDE